MTIEPVSLTLPPATIPQTERLPACDRLLDSEPAKVVDRAWDELVDWFDRQREWVELVASLESVRGDQPTANQPPFKCNQASAR